MRCLALAEAWRTYGGDVALLGHIESEKLQKRIVAMGIQYIALSGTLSFQNDLNQLDDFRLTCRDAAHRSDEPPWLVLDGYHFDTAYQHAVRQQGYRLCVVDDFAHLGFYDADVLLNQNIGADQLDYRFPPSTQTLLGPKYVMLRGQFLSWHRFERSFTEQAPNILVTVGGTDVRNQIPKVLRALQAITSVCLTIKIVLGFDHMETEEFRQALDIASRLHKVELLQGVEDMPSLMAWADLAVAAGGSTTYELAFMGVPMILMAIAENQLGVVQGLHQAGAAVSLGWYEHIADQAMIQAIDQLSANCALRSRMSLAGRNLVDGRGSTRIVQTCLQLDNQNLTKDEIV